MGRKPFCRCRWSKLAVRHPPASGFEPHSGYPMAYIVP